MDFSSEMSSNMPVVTGGESWPGKEGISGISSGAAKAASGGGRGNVDENEGRGSSSSGVDWGKSPDKNWEEAMAAASEGLSLNQEKNGNYMKFALADLSSAAAGAHWGKNSGNPHSVISYTQARNPAVHARKPATLSLQSQKLLLGGMIPCNAADSSPQIPPYGFPIPYNPTYHVNSSSMSGCQFSPPMVEKSSQNEKVQNNRSLSELLNLQEQGNREKEDGSLQSMGSLFQFARVTSEKHVWNERTQNKESSSKLIDFGQDVRGNQDGSVHSWGSSLLFAPETPEKNAQNERAQNNRSPAMLIDFGINERSNQERNQGYSFQYSDSPGNDAIEICCDQDLSQSLAIHHSQFAPATPAKNPPNETTQNNQYPSTLIDFNVKEIGNQEKNQGCSLLSRVSPGNEAFEICFDQGITQSSAQLDEIPNAGKGEIHVIDLNKTPQQKTRRKKHRPKVVSEKKSKRTPKTATPKQSGSQENATGRKSHKHSQTPLPCVGEPAAAQPGKLDIPSCKRSLNFESESKSGDGGLGTSEIYHNELDNREDVSKVANLQAVEGPQVENRSSGITIDLNSSMAEWPDSNLASSQNLTMSSPLKRKIPSRENLKDMARKRSNIGIMSGTVEDQDDGNSPNRDSYEVLQDDPGSVIECQLDSNIGSQPPSTHNQLGFKELNQEYGHTAQNTVFHSVNLVGPHMNPMKTHLEMLQRFQYPGNGKNHNEHCFRIYKKERTRRPKNGTSKTTFGMSSFSMPMAQAQIPAKFQREDRMGIGFHKPQDYGSMLALSQIELKTKKRSKAITRIRNMANFFVSRCDQMLAMHLNRTLGHDAEQGQDISHRPQSCVEALITNNQAKMVTKKRTRKVSHDSSSTPFSPANQVHAQKDEIIVYDNRQCFVGSTSSLLGPEAIRSNASSPRKLKKQDLHLPPTNFVHDCQSSSNLCGAVAMVPLVDPIDEIVHRLKYLNINRGDETVATQTENALVPYVRDETMIPYEGPFDLMKKRRPRPKVDLDVETLRQWKLLMGKDSRENLEGTDEDKEKWWEEEQRVFRGRADSFIARMHLVLGRPNSSSKTEENGQTHIILQFMTTVPSTI